MAEVDEHSINFIARVCEIAGDFDCISNSRRELKKGSIRYAIRSHDTAKLFDWFLRNVSLQGVSDQTALAYLAAHGSPTWAEISRDVRTCNCCPKLLDHWHFLDCGYVKSHKRCNQASHFAKCPLPRYDLRNGRLNQTAYGLFFFIRDVAGGDFVDWIDQQLVEHPGSGVDSTARLIQPLTSVFGIGDKVLNMSMASLLIGGRSRSSRWFEVGSRMIAVDSLVHNFLQRTGILRRCDREHSYGPRCYGSDGCASVVESISNHIDARRFNASFPKYFPRFIQHSIWRFCAQDEWNVCNGLRVKDGIRCRNTWCQIHNNCDRVAIPRQRKL